MSAVGITDTETAYAASKRAGEACLTARNLDWTVLRPVVVLGDDSYGGTSLVRAMAAFPFAIPMIGDGATPLNVIHKDDLAEGIVSLVTNGGGVREVLEPAAAGRLTLVELVAAYRNRLGFPPRPVLRLPMPVAKCVARVGDVMRMPPVTSTALAQLGGRLTGDGAGFRQATGVVPQGLDEILSDRPSGSQDLWHARLFLLRPLLRMALALLWTVSGLVGLLAEPSVYESVGAALGDAAAPLVIAFSLVDLAIAAALVRGWRLKLMADIQIAVIVGYTLGLSLLAPALWSDPFGALLKNVPILFLVLVHRRECRWVHSRLSRVRLRAPPAPPPTLNTSCQLACVRHVVSSDTAFRHASRLAAMTRFPERLPSVVSPPPRLDHRRARGLVAPVPRGFRCGVRPSAVRGGGSGSANRSAWQRGPGSESAAALGGLQWLEVVSLREAGRFASRREASVEEADWRLFQKFGVGALAAPAVVLVLAQQPGEPGVVGVAIESLLRHSVPMQFLGR